MPYRGFQSFLLEHACKDSKIWTTCVTLICFPMVVQQQTNKVMLQFGLCQDISNPLHNLDKIHHTDLRRHIDTNWAEEHQLWIAIRKERCKYVLISQPILGNIEHTSHYNSRKLNNILQNKAHHLLPTCMMKD